MDQKPGGPSANPERLMTRVKSPDDVPCTPHYAVLVYKSTSVYIPGDERSRQAPGHGYPEHTDTYETFEHWVTTNSEDLRQFVYTLEQPRFGDKKKYVVLNVTGRFTLEFNPTLVPL